MRKHSKKIKREKGGGKSKSTGSPCGVRKGITS